MQRARASCMLLLQRMHAVITNLHDNADRHPVQQLALELEGRGLGQNGKLCKRA